MRGIFLAAAFILAAGWASAEPFVFYRGVVNAASFAPPGLPNGSIARGSIFSIFGRKLGPTAAVQVAAFPLPTELAGVSIEVCKEGACVAALPLFVRADQINAIMPSDAPLGFVSIRVRYQGETGNWLTVRVAEASLGIFTVNSGGFGPGVLQNFISAADQPINSAVSTAARRQVVTMWGTGLGPGLNADREAPQPGSLPTQVEIWVGGKQATNILYSGRSPCCSGVDQLVFEIPESAPSGCYVPVEARVNGSVVSNTVTVATSSDGSACSDRGGEIMSAIRSGGRTGLVTLLRQLRYTDFAESLAIQETDIAVGEFREDVGGPFTYHPEWSLPPAGSCITQSIRGAVLDRSPRPGSGPSVQALDAGETLSVRAGERSIPVPKQAGRNHEYVELLGGRLGGKAASTLVQEGASSVVVSGPGGPDVGAFEASVPAPPEFSWTNRIDLIDIDRTQPLRLTWAGAPAGSIAWIQGGVSDFTTDSATIFSCVADAADGAFTVPQQALDRLPPLPARASRSNAWLSVGVLPAAGATPFGASGLDRGFAGSLRQITQTVRYQGGQP